MDGNLHPLVVGALIGHNNPPKPTPFEQSKKEIEDLCFEAKHWLDGEEITLPEVAAQVDALKVMIRDAVKLADERRKDEARPHDEAKAEIQERYNALIGDTKKGGKGIAITALEACDQALVPYLTKLRREKEEAEKKAFEEAEAKRRAADEAVRAAQMQDLAAKEEAEALLRDAKKSEAAAKKVSRQTTGLNTHLRRSWKPVMVDAREAAKWAWLFKQQELEAFLMELACSEVRGGSRAIPGFDVVEDLGVA